MEHISISIHDYSRVKQCDIYDSDAKADGQAYNIILKEELKGWKELTFELPKESFRWDYIKNDCLVRLRVGENEDWFIVQVPKVSYNGKGNSYTVNCSHICAVLKTKNLYLTFDDETGIGTIDYLIGRALQNTGWTIGECDTFYERDGETEKIRSQSSDGKKGSYQLVLDICDLFNAYPVYHGDTKRVDIRSLDNKFPIAELAIGKNLSALNVEYRSDNIITRLYVEGDYGEDGYIGIDDAEANPTGQTFLLNFDYYRQIGLFKQEHEDALEAYLDTETGLPGINAQIKTKMEEINEGEDQLNSLWGQCDYDLYFLNNGVVVRKFSGGSAINHIPEAWVAGGRYQKGDLVYGENDVVYRAKAFVQSETFSLDDWEEEIAENDKLYVFQQDEEDEEDGLKREYRIVTGSDFETTDKYAVRFNTPSSGKIGAHQVAIEAKEKMLVTLQQNYESVPRRNVVPSYVTKEEEEQGEGEGV